MGSWVQRVSERGSANSQKQGFKSTLIEMKGLFYQYRLVVAISILAILPVLSSSSSSSNTKKFQFNVRYTYKNPLSPSSHTDTHGCVCVLVFCKKMW